MKPIREPSSVAGEKARVTWKLPRPTHDVALVAIASGPGVTLPYWATPRPYQPSSLRWRPRVLGATNPIRVDGNGDGVFNSPRAQAAAIIARTGHDPEKLIPALASSDEAVAAQAADLHQASGRDITDPGFRNRLNQAAEPVRRGFAAYAATLAEPAHRYPDDANPDDRGGQVVRCAGLAPRRRTTSSQERPGFVTFEGLEIGGAGLSAHSVRRVSLADCSSFVFQGHAHRHDDQGQRHSVSSGWVIHDRRNQLRRGRFRPPCPRQHSAPMVQTKPAEHDQPWLQRRSSPEAAPIGRSASRSMPSKTKQFEYLLALVGGRTRLHGHRDLRPAELPARDPGHGDAVHLAEPQGAGAVHVDSKAGRSVEVPASIERLQRVIRHAAVSA